MPGRRIAVAAAALVAAALVAAQVLLPGAAERNLREELAATGDVRRVEVGAFPAVKLLFGRADRVEVEMGQARAATSRLADLISRTRRTGELDARVATVQIGPLLVRDVRLDKRDGDLRGEAAVTDADLTGALPVALAARPLEAGPDGLVLAVQAGPLTGRARVAAQDGAVVVAPDGLLGALGGLTVFADPRVDVRAVGARERPDGFVLTAQARLR